MKTFLKILAGIVLTLSCFYLSGSLFVHHFVEDDIVETVTDSTLIQETLDNVSQETLVTGGFDTTQSDMILALMENDQEAKDVLKQYASTLLNDSINDENTFDETLLLEQLNSKKDLVYEVLQPQMSKEQFEQIYQDTLEQLDLQQMYQSAVEKVTVKMDEQPSAKEMLSLIYFFHDQYHIYVAFILMVISVVYLALISIKENGVLAGSIALIYLFCGILTLLMAFAIVLVLSAIVPSTMKITISSIRYMYLTAGIYIVIAAAVSIAHVFLKRKNN